MINYFENFFLLISNCYKKNNNKNKYILFVTLKFFHIMLK